MLAGQRPFWSSNTSDIYQNIQAGRYKKLPENLSPEVSHLLSILLSTDPLKRATMLDVLNHPWMKTHPTRVKRSDSSPFLLSPHVSPHASSTCLSGSVGRYGSINNRKQPHPLLIARKAKGISCEQFDLSGFKVSPTSSLVAISERLAKEKNLCPFTLIDEQGCSSEDGGDNSDSTPHHNNCSLSDSDNGSNNNNSHNSHDNVDSSGEYEKCPFLEDDDDFQLESPPSAAVTSAKILDGMFLQTMITTSLTTCDGQITGDLSALTPAEY